MTWEYLSCLSVFVLEREREGGKEKEGGGVLSDKIEKINSDEED